MFGIPDIKRYFCKQWTAKINIMKYYWISYANTTGGEFYPKDVVTTVHPFRALQHLKVKERLYNATILNWKEITQEEYDVWLSLNK